VSARKIAGTLAVLAFGGAAFCAGIGVERSGHNPVPAAVPVAGDKPKHGLVQTVGKPSCSQYDRFGYHKDDGCQIYPGEGFRVGFYTVKDGWSIKPGKEGPVATLTVWNNNPGAIARFWETLHLRRYDGSLVELLWCESEKSFAAGQYVTLTCEAHNPEGNGTYDEVWIS